MTNLSKRAQKAVDVLAQGGRFVNRLERDNYTGREQFHQRLFTSKSRTSLVKGFGFAAFNELMQAGLLVYADGEWTSVSEVYKLPELA
jgi:uncharacterized protein YjhX (UPF0386 family)